MNHDQIVQENKTIGLLTDTDINICLENEEIIIHPFEDYNLTPVGYNLTPSDFILSINNQLLVKIHFDEKEKFCFIEPNDTVVIMTREALKIGKNIAGTFHSRVSIVSKGLGHISTTLDPLWQGPLLVSINNPTKRRIKLTLAKILNNQKQVSSKEENEYKNPEKENLTFRYSAFVTLMFTKTATTATKYHNNPSGRFDLLSRIVDKPNNRRIFSWTKKYKHFLKLKKMIDSIGSIDFISNVDPDKNVVTTKEIFEDNYKGFAEVLQFYTDQAHDVSEKIKNSNHYRKILFKILRISGIILGTSALLYFIWKVSKGAAEDGMVSYFSIIIMVIAWAFTQIVNIGRNIK